MVLVDVYIKNVDKRRVCGDHREMQNYWAKKHYHTGVHEALVMEFPIILYFRGDRKNQAPFSRAKTLQ